MPFFSSNPGVPGASGVWRGHAIRYHAVMSERPRLRRLIDLPGMADLEFAAVMKPRMAEADARADFPAIDEVARANFSLTPDEADAVADPADWDNIDAKAPQHQVFPFEDAGWDVTDNKRRPMRLLPQFSRVLWLAIRGVAGELPFQADEAPEDAAASLAKEAKAFQRNKR